MIVAWTNLYLATKFIILGAKVCVNRKLSYIRHEDTCIASLTTSQGWLESRQLCLDDNADLVKIRDRSLNNFLAGYRWTLIRWIGLNDRDTEGVFQWTDGTRVCNIYSCTHV